jgi:hypothetical protein
MSVWIGELKGAKDRKRGQPGINDYPALRDRFFSRLAGIEGLAFRIIYLDRGAHRWLDGVGSGKLYGKGLQLILSTVRIARSTKLVSVAIDSMSTAKPSWHRQKSYRWRGRREGQRKQRKWDKVRHKAWSQRIDDTLRMIYQGVQLHRKVWIIPSHECRGIQAADILSNFCFRYHRLHIGSAPFAHARDVAAGTDGYRPRRTPTREWFASYRLLQSKTLWMHNPRIGKLKDMVEWYALHRGARD